MNNLDLLDVPYEKRKYVLIVESQKEEASILKELKKYFVIPSLIARPIPTLLVYLSSELLRQIEKRIKANIYFATSDQVSGIVFPGIGSPQKNMLYVCNPVDPKRYYHINNFHNEMEKHKMNEIIYLLQSLGAVEINVALENSSQRNTTVGLADDRQQTHSSKNSDLKLRFHGTYEPKHSPYIPVDLNWYDDEPQWKNIAQERMRYELKSFEFEIGIENDFGVTAKLFAQLKKIPKIQLGGEYHSFQKKHLVISGNFKDMLM
ncbi:hypothetical protein E4665_12380 [Sporolactobacillus shoreae]|uniref:Uncharacterized protein n=1 Tax=Sporolactobacillus shoreae TaxID=1465501 RepID=A0A4Z0GML7_9BACL|nr:hypothetical protein [Sporolactobacillus shoreae]TGA97416.1 hypothetical protein E4665_12380 [Sporolactobacillus shoreae]